MTITDAQIQGATTVVEAEADDWRYGKPDEGDFIRMILKGANLPSRDNDDPWLRATADAIFEDSGEKIQSAEDMARFVLDRYPS